MSCEDNPKHRLTRWLNLRRKHCPKRPLRLCTKIIIFGPLPAHPPKILRPREVVEVVDSYTYVGILVTSTKRFIFSAHLEQKALHPSVLVQHLFLRRLLGLNLRCVTVVLFTETELQPLRYRRLLLTLRYLVYLLSDKPTLPYIALQHFWVLATNGNSSWVANFCASLTSLPISVLFPYVQGLSLALATKAIEDVQHPLEEHLRAQFVASERLPLLAERSH